MSNLLGKDGLEQVVCEIGWDPSETQVRYDLDLVALICRNGQLTDSSNIITGNTTYDPESPIQHTGDNRDGQNDEGEEGTDGVGDEQIQVNLLGLSPEIDKIAFAVVSNGKDLTFDIIKGAFFRMFNPIADEMLHELNLTQKGQLDSALAVQELVRTGDTWQSKEVFFGSETGIEGIAAFYGLTNQL